MGDLITRNVDSWVCAKPENHMVNCLLVAKVADLLRHLDKLM